ncbi:PREDICTED: uncharacterized protein LOC106814003, partial [Priapulus caudatus]|uniref:Uncharacterized protein LOC106814003 n=1 Tax=Priapulus caudatus TaxID=37621 RepID=A0ABM1ENH3_PRICU
LTTYLLQERAAAVVVVMSRRLMLQLASLPTVACRHALRPRRSPLLRAACTAGVSPSCRPLHTCSVLARGDAEAVPEAEEVASAAVVVEKERSMLIPDELVRDFLDPARFFEAVRSIGVEFFCGVPDSLLKDFCAYVTSKVAQSNHVITCNEGSAVALAAGYHIATGRHGLVYMQNSGLGNAVNPLLSLASTGVYSVPMLLLVGWRGEPGKRGRGRTW